MISWSELHQKNLSQLFQPAHNDYLREFPDDYPMNFNSHTVMSYLMRVPLKHQKHCDMCWSIVGTDTVAMGLSIRHPSNVVEPLLSTDVLNCAANRDSSTCYPNYLNASFIYMAETGVMKENETNRFVAMKSPCLEKTLQQEYDLVRIEGYEWLDHNNERALMDAVRISPIAVGLKLTEDFQYLNWEVYKGSSRYVRDINGGIVGHAVVLIGYGFDSVDYTRFWIVKNSEGPEWGVFGFGRIARASSNLPGRENLLTAAVRPVFDKESVALAGRPTGYWYEFGTKFIYHH